MTVLQLEARLDWVEGLIQTAHPKDLPCLNDLYQKILDRLVKLDLDAVDDGKKK